MVNILTILFLLSLFYLNGYKTTDLTRLLLPICYQVHNANLARFLPIIWRQTAQHRSCLTFIAPIWHQIRLRKSYSVFTESIYCQDVSLDLLGFCRQLFSITLLADFVTFFLAFCHDII